jgi:hypothetical protein
MGRTIRLTAAPDIAPALDREVLGHPTVSW